VRDFLFQVIKFLPISASPLGH